MVRWPSGERIAVYIVAALLAATVSFLVDTPYSLILPGSAIDVREVLTVAGHAPPAERYYMTDVTLQERISPILLLEAFLPGARLVRTSEVVPQGVTIPQFDEIMRHAMDESQSIAAVVAEREANLPVGIPKSRVAVVRFDPSSQLQKILEPGDVLRTVNGQAVQSTINVQNALFKIKPGDSVTVSYQRGANVKQVRVPTISLKGKARLGVYLIGQFDPPKLPVPVQFKKFNVAGSSGGLMFAMDIYRTLKPRGSVSATRIAGTGTIDYNGIVGPIEGAPQKLIAARREGATVFFVPRENFADVAGIKDIRVIPVHTFKEALHALSS